MMRVFNGDWSWDPLGAALHLVHLGQAICSPKVYETPGECIQAALSAAAALPGGAHGTAFDVLCLSDVASVIGRGGESAAHALHETAEVVGAAVQVLEESHGASGRKNKA